MPSTKYSVADVADMLVVNKETVRRWIRENKLKADIAKGRGGNTIYLQNIVDFVNETAREYMLPLQIWLTENKIPFKIVEIDKNAENKKKATMRKVAGAGAAATAATTATAATAATTGGVGAGFTAAALSSTIPVAGPVVAAGIVASTVLAHQFIKKKKNKDCPYYIIVLTNEVATENSEKNEPENSESATEAEVTNRPVSSDEENATDSAPEQNEAQNPPKEEASPPVSVLDEIARAKQMVDMGIFTEEEFAEIKARLIARL